MGNAFTSSCWQPAPLTYEALREAGQRHGLTMSEQQKEKAGFGPSEGGAAPPASLYPLGPTTLVEQPTPLPAAASAQCRRRGPRPCTLHAGHLVLSIINHFFVAMNATTPPRQQPFRHSYTLDSGKFLIVDRHTEKAHVPYVIISWDRQYKTLCLSEHRPLLLGQSQMPCSDRELWTIGKNMQERMSCPVHGPRFVFHTYGFQSNK